ncbi:EamA family transporter [Flavihumibacter fluvii]|uniref:EamA family transporter n=1 Tax=Flavihumibacter fluvii TaxID=2838157 RepID=UPI001BDDEBCD|nr:EamA family transporter [Flavihumibacter fluvii]ULQ53451.1 EamA family transporter [Flavihumibacter fluvii]
MGNLKVLMAFAAIYFIWGATYLAAWFGLDSIPPYLLSALRFSLAGIILLVYGYTSNGSLPGIRSFKINGIAGSLMLVGGSGSVLWAQQYLGTALAAILVSSLPIWFIILDRQQWKVYRIQPLVIAGIILGFLGIILLFGFTAKQDPTTMTNDRQVLSIAVLLAGCVLWTIGSLFVTYRPVAEPISTGTGVQLLAGGLVSLLISIAFGETANFSFANVSVNAWLGLAYLILFGSVIAYLAYVWLLTVRPAAQVGTFAYVNPVVAVFLGAFVAHEKIPGIQVIALAIILVSILLVNLPNYQTLKGAKNDR